MADDLLNPTTTTITTSTADVDAAAAANNAFKISADALKTSLDGLGISEKEQSIALKKLKEGFSGLIPDSLNLKQVFEGLSKSTGIDSSPITKMFSGVSDQIVGVIENVAGFGGAITALGDSTTRDFFNPIKQGGVEILDSFLPDKLKGKAKDVRDAIQGMLDVQNTSRVGFTRWQNSFLRTTTAIEKSNEAASAYVQTLRRVSDSHVVSGATLDNMMKALQGMPIILNQDKEILDNITKAQSNMVEELGKLINVSQAFGMTEAEATERAKSGYMDFNQSVNETISSLAAMESASKMTGVDRKIADEQIRSASKSLTIFGQKSDAAASLWTTFTSSLKDTIPIKQVGEIVSDVTSKIAGMSVQNRAFISMMSGMSQGRSAMGGALQLEVAMRSPEGMEKNLQAMTSTLSQFAGGKIITLEEAANNPQLEIQFQLQRDLLGKISGITDTQNQNRVLEVLQKVQAGGMSQVDGGKELSSLMQKGGDIQERQLNALDQIANHTRVLSGDILKPENQFEQIGNALLGRTQAVSDPTKGSARVRRAIKETPQKSSLIKEKSIQESFGKMFHGIGEGLEKVIRVDLVGAIDGLKKIFEASQSSSINKNVVVPLEPRKNPPTTVDVPVPFKDEEKIKQIVKEPQIENRVEPPISKSPMAEEPSNVTVSNVEKPKTRNLTEQPNVFDIGELTRQEGKMASSNVLLPLPPPPREMPTPTFDAKEAMRADVTSVPKNTEQPKSKGISAKTETSQGEGEFIIKLKYDGSLPSGVKNIVRSEINKFAENLRNTMTGQGASQNG